MIDKSTLTMVRKLLADALRQFFKARLENPRMANYHQGAVNTHILYALMIGAITPHQAGVLEDFCYKPLKRKAI